MFTLIPDNFSCRHENLPGIQSDRPVNADTDLAIESVRIKAVENVKAFFP